MKKLVFIVMVACAVLAHISPARSAKPPEDGTTAEELAALNLQLPEKIKVAVLPLWDYTSNVHHQRVGTAAVYKWFEHEGFQLMPIHAGFAALAADKELEPGMPLRKAEAIRNGRALGADWVVYGEIKELRVYEKAKLWGPGKKILCSLRLSVADCESGEVLYWKVRQDTMGDSGLVVRKSTTLIRVALQSVSENILRPLFAATPKHELRGQRPDDASLLEFEKVTWPEGGD